MSKNPIVAAENVAWTQHPRFAGISMRVLLSSADNAYANVNIVRVPVGAEVGRHLHPTQIETVYVLAGQSVLTLGETEHLLPAGSITAIPIGLEHSLRNAGDVSVELLAFFTPPLA